MKANEKDWIFRNISVLYVCSKSSPVEKMLEEIILQFGKHNCCRTACTLLSHWKGRRRICIVIWLTLVVGLPPPPPLKRRRCALLAKICPQILKWGLTVFAHYNLKAGLEFYAQLFPLESELAVWFVLYLVFELWDTFGPSLNNSDQRPTWWVWTDHWI